MVDKKLSQFDEASESEVRYFPVLDSSTKNRKLPARVLTGIKTNCITNIPQDIQLELNNGTLTLKSGSKVYVPNGAGVFDGYTTTEDKTVVTSNRTGKTVLFYRLGDNTARANVYIENCSSGTTPPTNGMFYDTSLNKVVYYSSGSSSGVYSLPLAIITVSSGTVTSVDQVFNGFGYIGSTVFALPGVKGLIPNGRNEDGTLKNTVATVSSVKTGTINSSTAAIGMTSSGTMTNRTSSFRLNEVENINYQGTTKLPELFVGKCSHDSNLLITSFYPRTPFHAVDYNDAAILNGNNTFYGNNMFSGNNTFTGTNTFGKSTTLSTSTSEIYYLIKNTDLDITESSRSSNKNSFFRVYDKNDYIVGNVGLQALTDGRTIALLEARNRATGSQVSGTISVTVNNAGAVSTAAPTPSDVTDNSTKIATTAFIANKFQVVSTLPANPVSGVYYFIPEE